MGRYGTTDEVSALIGFLASEGAGYITGQNLRIDGGTHSIPFSPFLISCIASVAVAPVSVTMKFA